MCPFGLKSAVSTGSACVFAQNFLILLEFVVSEIRFAKRLAQSREVAKKARKLGVLGDFA